MSENIISQNREFMAKCATDSYMQGLMMRHPDISEDLYLQKYMEVYNKSLAVAERMQKQSEASLEPFGAAEKAAALLK